MQQAPPRLEFRSVHAGYGRSVVLRDISLNVPQGSVVALLGANGAGKTTLLRTAAGLVAPSAGNVYINGHDVGRRDPSARAEAGLCLVPEGRGIFRELTVRDNLRIQRPAWVRTDHTPQVLGAFPILASRMNQVAGSLSGGEQQMLALARTYMAEPSILLLDEVSLGLAPVVIEHLFASLKEIAATGVSLLLVEQYVDRALDMADTVILLDRGHIAFTGSPDELDHDALLANYLGTGGAPGATPVEDA